MRWTVAFLVLALGACGGGAPTEPSPPVTPPAAAGPPPPSPALQPLVVIDPSGQLASGFDLQVNTSRETTGWLTPSGDALLAAYPSGQQWGFVGGVLVGPTAPGSSPGRDLSAYRTLQIQLRGMTGGESLEIGIKDNTDPDNGTEAKKTVVLSSSWQTFSYPLSDFATADMRRVYLLFELVFNGTTSRSVYFRDVRYVP